MVGVGTAALLGIILSLSFNEQTFEIKVKRIVHVKDHAP